MELPDILLLIFSAMLMLGCAVLMLRISVRDPLQMLSIPSIERRAEPAWTLYFTRGGIVCLLASLMSLIGLIGMLSQ
jgi:hypothetical protein